MNPAGPPAGLPAVALVAASALAAAPARGPVDYDVDDDGLVEIRSLDQLDAVRYSPFLRSPNGDWFSHGLAFPDPMPHMGSPGEPAGYELAADLDFDSDGDGTVGPGDRFWNKGLGMRQIPWFCGEFEGNGRVIRNLRARPRPDGRLPENGAGLFGALGAARGDDGGWSPCRGVVRNLGLVDVDMDGGSSLLGSGALAVVNDGLIENVRVFGRVRDAGRAGGVVSVNRGDVARSGSDVEVTGLSGAGGVAATNAWPGRILTTWSKGPVRSRQEAGGLVGGMLGGFVFAGHATGPVGGWERVGGLVGFLGRDALVVTGYAAGRVDCRVDCGGLAGVPDGLVRDAWFDARAAGLPGERGFATDALTAPGGYEGIYARWDDYDVDGDRVGEAPWSFRPGGYPSLVGNPATTARPPLP